MTIEPHQRKDHQADHPGCSAFRPWMRSCRRWKNPDLLNCARAEVVGMPEAERERFVGQMRKDRGYYRLRNDARFGYIAVVEGWRPEQFRHAVQAAEILDRRLDMSAVEVAHEAAIVWNQHRQQLALAVLFAYGEIR